jgi:hypothetical protein
MPLFDWIFNASLLSRQRLMQARGFYAPTKGALPPEQEFGKWTERVAQLGESISARELAGLGDPELAALQAEFLRSPVRRQSELTRRAIPLGAGALMLGCIGLVLLNLGLWQGGALAAAQYVAIALLGIGVSALAVGLLGAFGAMHLDLSHGTTGLLVGKLDDQHPWLYKAMALTCNASAEAYRQAVLRDRGSLRGLDYVTMKEIVAAHEAIERTRSTRSVADQLQAHVSTRLAAVVHHRIVRLVAPVEHRRRATDLKLAEVPLVRSDSVVSDDDREQQPTH